MTARHWPTMDNSGFVCPATGKTSRYIWTVRPGVLNACEHCTGQKRTAASDLASLQSKRREATK